MPILAVPLRTADGKLKPGIFSQDIIMTIPGKVQSLSSAPAQEANMPLFPCTEKRNGPFILSRHGRADFGN
jgi:hypothetical protein